MTSVSPQFEGGETNRQRPSTRRPVTDVTRSGEPSRPGPVVIFGRRPRSGMMGFVEEFTVPTDIDTAWATFADLEDVALCLPGATLKELLGDTSSGRRNVKGARSL